MSDHYSMSKKNECNLRSRCSFLSFLKIIISQYKSCNTQWNIQFYVQSASIMITQKGYELIQTRKKVTSRYVLHEKSYELIRNALSLFSTENDERMLRYYRCTQEVSSYIRQSGQNTHKASVLCSFAVLGTSWSLIVSGSQGKRVRAEASVFKKKWPSGYLTY